MAAPSSKKNDGTSLEGEVEKVVFEAEESGFSVVRIRVAGKRAPVTIVGRMSGLREGESVKVEGHWKTDPKFGEQLEVERFESVLPATVEGIRRYLASGMVKNIGPKMAERIVAKFGAKTLDVLEKTPKKLGEVEGIGPKRVESLKKSWDEQREVRAVMVFLQGHGVSPSHAHRIFKKFGNGAARIVQENPYRLADEVWGIGFKTADAIARRVGIGEDDPRRVEAGVMFSVTEAAGDGHCYLPAAELSSRVEALLGVNGKPEAVEAASKRLAEDERLEIETDGIFQLELIEAERGAAKRLAALLQARSSEKKPLEAEKALAWIAKETTRELAPAQRDALVHAAGGKITVITGGPGTGKTTVVDAICRVVRARKERVMLAAPTGRAAKRLSEATGLEAKTVHRALEMDPKTGGFLRGRSNPLQTDVLVVDECSMVDLPLFASILDAVPDSARLVMVGDADQLPSVGPGNVLRDVIDSGAVPTVRLKEIFRQASASAIVRNAHLVNAGEIPAIEGDDFFVVGREEPEAAVEAVCEMVAERIPRKFGLDPIRDVQVLAPMNRGVAGTANLNAALQARLNPGGREISLGPRRFRIGDRVLQTRNDYDKEVWNGDLGRVVAFDDETRSIEVEIDGRRIHYDASDVDDLILSYATTIHRSQGSEYPAVVIPILTQHFVMLQRNLLYTAITRGKKLVVLVGSKKAVAMAVRNDQGSARWTRLAARIREAV